MLLFDPPVAGDPQKDRNRARTRGHGRLRESHQGVGRGIILIVMDGVRVLLRLFADAAALAWPLRQSPGVVVAENLFWHKQLAISMKYCS